MYDTAQVIRETSREQSITKNNPLLIQNIGLGRKNQCITKESTTIMV